jgi:hypothetical protein
MAFPVDNFSYQKTKYRLPKKKKATFSVFRLTWRMHQSPAKQKPNSQGKKPKSKTQKDFNEKPSKINSERLSCFFNRKVYLFKKSHQNPFC